MKNFMSITSIKRNAITVAMRFTVSCIFAVALALTLIVSTLLEEYHGILVHYLSAGYLLSLMLSLWAEEGVNKKKTRIVWIVAHAALVVDALVLWIREDGDFEEATYLAHAVVYVALVLGIFFLPFFREKDDIPSWNYARRITYAIVQSLLIGGIMTLGIMALFEGIEGLFNVSISYKCYTVAAILFMQLMPMLLVPSQIPSGKAKHDNTPQTSRFINRTTRYMFIPLVLSYMAVLFVYLLSILTKWELPNGTVSWLVTIMMCGMIAIEFLLYPTMRSGQAKRYESLIAKWLPIAAIPLIMLMSVGLIRRIADYGITTNRLYMITLNVWFYIVCIGLFLVKMRRIHWIPLSFGAILIVTSAHPFNYCEITYMYMYRKVADMIGKYPPAHTPMTAKEVGTWIATLPKDEQEDTYSSLQYLSNNYTRKKTYQWITKETTLWMSYPPEYDMEETVSFYDADTVAYYAIGDAVVSIPEGYSSVRLYKSNDIAKATQRIKDSILTITIREEASNSNADSMQYAIDIPQINKARKGDCKTFEYKEPTKGSIIKPKYILVKQKDEMIRADYSVYIFYK